MIRSALRRGLGSHAVFVRVASALSDDIRSGVRRVGDRLPSTRALAAQLGVHRNTVVAAYDELVSQGWIESRRQAGTYVCANLLHYGAHPSRGHGMAAHAQFATRADDLPEAYQPTAPAARRVRYSLSLGMPDTRLVPTAPLARAYRRALLGHPRAGRLDYGPPTGDETLRERLAAMLRAERGVPATADNILVTRGSQMALDLIARLLIDPRAPGAVAVEELGYRPAWRAFGRAGARVVPIRLDEVGLVVSSLARTSARCVYVTPHHQFPTTVVMSPPRRAALLALARDRRMAVIEDDYDHEFHFDGRPVRPLAADDRGAHVVYVGTLSKTVAPGLRLGFIAAPAPVVAQLAQLRHAVDRQGDHVLEAAVAELIEDGEVARHTRKMRRIYQSRRDAFAAALQRELGHVLTFHLPPGGITLWARVADDVSLDSWRSRAHDRGVALLTAQDFDFRSRQHPFVRLAFGRYNERELVDAVRCMRLALPRR